MGILTLLSPHLPKLTRRMGEFPTLLQPLLKLRMNMARLLSCMQLHPVIDDPSRLQSFAASFDKHGNLGFIRQMYVEDIY
jgi:hypothetical protein